MSNTIMNELGLPVRQGGSMDDPPAIILYGRAATGKSTEMAKSFPDAYWITTSNTVLRPFESWMRLFPAKAAEYGIVEVPDRVVLKLYDTKTREPIDPRRPLDIILQQITKLVEDGHFPYSGVVIDEMTYLSLHIAAQIPRSMGWGKVDVIKGWHHGLVQWTKSLNILLGMVCHEDPPKMTEKGKWYPGGPSLAIGTLREEINQLCDVCLRLVAEEVTVPTGVDAIVAANAGEDDAANNDIIHTEEGDISIIGEDGIRRFIVAGWRDDWVTKFRDFRIKSREPINVREMLVRADYPINRLRSV